MGRRKGGPRVLGPYALRDGRLRLAIVSATGERSYVFASTPAEAEGLRLAALAELVQPCETVEKAITAYRDHQKAKGNRKASYFETERRLRLFFADPGISLDMLTPKRCRAYYEAFARRTFTRPGQEPRLISVDYQRNTLLEARSFLRWCIGKQWLDRNPLEGVEPLGGTRKHGKAQLRVTEARTLYGHLCNLADGGDEAAIAALMAMVLGLRASEIIDRVARDVDDEGRLLWVPRGKTAKARRQVEVPEPLAGYLRELVEGLGPESRILPHRREWVRKSVLRLCGAAGVPKVPPHGLRGTHATLARGAGITGHVVAATLGHESARTTDESYAREEATKGADTRAVLKVLAGGRP